LEKILNLKMNRKFSVVGAGYVGISVAVLLSQKNLVSIVDIDKDKVNLINAKKSPIKDSLVTEFLEKKDLNLSATDDLEMSVRESEIVILALPTDYDSNKDNFNTDVLFNTISKVLRINQKALVLIKSTIPIGYTKYIRNKFNTNNIIFSPEFLREGSALYDNLYPSRIIVGSKKKNGKIISEIFANCAKNEPEIFLMASSEAESVKLFANSYLATRISFFNELDSFCLENELDTKSVIDGISSDPRIGLHYNNPSFGYGGYCLPKDTKQMVSNFYPVPQSIFSATVESNAKRKTYIANKIIELNPKTVGIYRLTMKKESDNLRESAIFDVIRILNLSEIKINLYEPILKVNSFESMDVINDLNIFKDSSEIIIANRIDENLNDVPEKIFSRDIYNEN
jgi:UDPglucose 6-dehydrogenase